jgi:hypothetical protein
MIMWMNQQRKNMNNSCCGLQRLSISSTLLQLIDLTHEPYHDTHELHHHDAHDIDTPVAPAAAKG